MRSLFSRGRQLYCHPRESGDPCGFTVQRVTMQIIIPMSGVGKRFIDAGYKDVKPLIEVDGLPIIAHVINMFPGENNFTFVCNKTHLQETPMEEILKGLAPFGKIIGIEPHKKGPVYAVAEVFDAIDEREETIVNYCDFSKYWDYDGFLSHTRARQADGAIAAYKGFHPHMLGSTNYAFMRDDQQWLLEIQEKEPFTDNRMQEYASDGTYYFKNGGLVKKYFQQLMDEDINLKGEYYISLVYTLMLRDGLKSSVYEIQHMLQWGEPGHLQEYQQWSKYFSKMVDETKSIINNEETINLIPLAGRGQRFVDEGYQTPKPLIDVSGKPMIVQAASYLPQSGAQTFICLEDHLKEYPIKVALLEAYPQANIVSLNEVTEGQACTCEKGIREEDYDKPLFIAASDNGMIWSEKKLQSLLDDTSIGCLVWSFRHHPSSAQNPQMYGWIKTDEKENVLGVSVKVPISDDPFNDHAIIGAFYFRKARFFIDALERLYKSDVRVNNEFYVDSCINEIVAMGLKAKVFEVDHYICWGTPNDLKTYEYWQSYFHKSDQHPYCLEKDRRMELSKLKDYEKKYSSFKQEHN